MASSGPVTSYRARLYRLIFTAAAAYNIAFGLWAAVFPLSFFALFALPPPRYPAIWGCLGMVVGLYGLVYALAARRLEQAAPLVAIGLLGKLLGPIGWVATVAPGEWPLRTVTLVLFNDVIWWLPFGLFLLDGTRFAAAVRRSAPFVCAALNLAALVAMATALRGGTELIADPDRRFAYMAEHPVLWRGGWSVWVAAALSLVAFYAWWGAHLRSWPAAVAALGVATLGLAADLLAESWLAAWVPEGFHHLAPAATLLTGVLANGLYTLAGVLLTLATPGIRGALRALTWAVWSAGFGLSAAALAQSPPLIAAATGILFALFCPWVAWFGHRLRRAG
jgi:hypothetical protein